MSILLLLKNRKRYFHIFLIQPVWQLNILLVYISAILESVKNQKLFHIMTVLFSFVFHAKSYSSWNSLWNYSFAGKSFRRNNSGRDFSIPWFTSSWNDEYEDLCWYRLFSFSFKKIICTAFSVMISFPIDFSMTRLFLAMWNIFRSDADVRLARRIRRDTVEKGRDLKTVLDQVGFSIYAKHSRLWTGPHSDVWQINLEK